MNILASMKTYGQKRTGEHRKIKKESEEMYMNMDTFCETVINVLTQELTGCSFTKNEVMKNNGVIMHGLMIQKDEKTSVEPQFYLDVFYENYKNGRDLNEIAKEIAVLYREQENKKIHQFDVAWMMDFENVKDIISLRLINLEKNKELLQDMPYRKFLDLALVYCLQMDMEDDVNGYVRVNNHLMERWGVDEERLYEQAFINTPKQNKGIVIPLEAIFSELLQDDINFDNIYESDIFDMVFKESLFYMCSNKSKSYGAVAVLYPKLLEKMAEQIGDLYVIPSSVHEVLLIKASQDTSPKELLQMVREVNETEVSMEEFLSDNIYFYDKKEQNLKLITE